MKAGKFKITNSESGKSLTVDDGKGNSIRITVFKGGIYIDDPKGHIDSSSVMRDFLTFANTEKLQALDKKNNKA